MFRLTWLDSNSWLIELGSRRILLDPWLVGSLEFGGLPWLFQAQRPSPLEIPTDIDLILLSQGLPDHAHRPTLAVLDKGIPVVASPSAAQVARALGFRQVTSLGHGEQWTEGSLSLSALVGAPVGPLLRENAYVVRHPEGSFYYEPHGYPSPGLAALDPVDVVITPVVDLTLPLGGAIIQGGATILDVVKALQPRVVIPTAMAGEIVYSGLLAAWIQTVGSLAIAQATLGQNDPSTTLIEPQVGRRIDIEVAKDTTRVRQEAIGPAA